MQNFKQLLYLLSSDERKKASLLLIMILIMALLDMIGVASILPFIAVLTNPALIETNLILNDIYKTSERFGVENNQQFIFLLGCVFFVLLTFSLIFKILTNYIQVRFIQMRQYSISKRLIKGYLNQPYSWFLSRHSAEIGKNILSEVGLIVIQGLTPLLDLIAKFITTTVLVILLLIVSPKLTLIVGLILSTGYIFIFFSVNKYLNRAGKERLEYNLLRFKIVNEAFGGIKEVKIGSIEDNYINSYKNSAKKFALINTSSQAISELPRFIVELIAFGGILLMILFMVSQTGNINSAIPTISLYVFAGYRLIPAIQQIYSSFISLTFIGSSLNKLYLEFINLKPLQEIKKKETISFAKEIKLNNITYNYPNSSRIILKNINLNIKANSTVGIVGTTGSGKTTMIDIILGLLKPQKGTLEVDGKVITSNNLRSWKSLIGYVPQHIYLSDDTIKANIAFGINKKKINQASIEKAAKTSNLHNFVINELPEKYETKIGERGVRLSGGQRQRIGIARALYNNPQLLVLDEATSSLDNETEQAVMDAVNNLDKDITIIIIAHRFNTVKNCDIIFKLKKGELVDFGSFNKIIGKYGNK